MKTPKGCRKKGSGAACPERSAGWAPPTAPPRKETGRVSVLGQKKAAPGEAPLGWGKGTLDSRVLRLRVASEEATEPTPEVMAAEPGSGLWSV
jgi:hypothetical protein